jgi:ATP-dependent DNA helicase PIF1
MDEDQQKALGLARLGKSFFLTGAGGTGKSYVTRDIVNTLRKDGKIVALTAMTGCASLLLGEDAKTLHSWAGIGLGKEEVTLILAKIRKYQKARKNWLATDTLIIDEISMMTPDLLDKLDLIAKNMKRSAQPFGGIQLILVGDMYQLPPVNREGPQGSFFVFESEAWKNIIKDSVNLKFVHRQSDPIFLKILDEARSGLLSEESVKILESRKTNSWKKLEIKPTLLFTRRADVDEINTSQLKKCPGEDIIYQAKTKKTQQHLTENHFKDHVEKIVEKMDKSGAYVPNLHLRKGAQVMYLINGIHMDKEARETALEELNSLTKPDHMTNEEWWAEKKERRINISREFDDTVITNIVNGSRGVIEGFTEWTNYPIVKFMNGDIHVIRYHTWPAEDGVQRQQIPLRLAYAITIHKAQGATLDCALIDIGKNTFEYGQAYVALSRVKSLDSLYIWELDPGAFRVNPKVKVFLDSLSHIP